MDSTQPLREQEQAAMRDRRRQEILSAGMQLCLEKGIVEVDMKEIAIAAQVSRATLYRYYPSKRALVYAILRHQTTERITPKYHAERMAFTGNGYEKFSQFVAQLVEVYYQFPDFYRLIGMINFYYGTQHHDEDLAQLYRDIFQGLLVEDTPQLYLEEGQHDGSIRQDINPNLYTAMVIEAIVGLAEQLATNKEVTQQTYGLENPDLLLELMSQAFLRSLQVG